MKKNGFTKVPANRERNLKRKSRKLPFPKVSQSPPPRTESPVRIDQKKGKPEVKNSELEKAKNINETISKMIYTFKSHKFNKGTGLKSYMNRNIGLGGFKKSVLNDKLIEEEYKEIVQLQADELKKEDKSTPFTIFNSSEYKKDQIKSRAAKLIAHSRARSSGIDPSLLKEDPKSIANSAQFEGSKAIANNSKRQS